MSGHRLPPFPLLLQQYASHAFEIFKWRAWELIYSMIAQAFEIKVAILGYVSVGKTTVLNALFQDKFSEVSLRRTTAGINLFRISAPQDHQKKRRKMNEDTSNDMDWSAETEEPRSPSSILEEIVADNKELREKNEIREKVFDIELDKNLCEMREDTKLVIADIPGVNEAGSSKMYMDYVSEKWDTFDCAVVVMDARQGVNTEEQVHLLEFIKKNLEEKKAVPVIVLCNKVDDPDDEEMKLLVDEVRSKVEHIFKVNCREAALSNALQGRRGNHVWPAFIPISAGNAFLYRTACRLELKDFMKLDADFIDKIGREEVGRLKWKKLSQAEKYKVAHSAVSNESDYQERLEATHFDKFLEVLALACGGKDTQTEMIHKQLEVAKRNLSFKSCIADQILFIYERCKAIGRSTKAFHKLFWTEYSKCQRVAFFSFSSDMKITEFYRAVDQLVDYADRVVPTLFAENPSHIEREKKKVIESMKRLVIHQCGVLCEKESQWNVTNSNMMALPTLTKREDRYNSSTGRYKSSWHNDITGQIVSSANAPASPFIWTKKGDNEWENVLTKQVVHGPSNPGLDAIKLTWKTLSPHDWFTIARSILLLSCNKHFCGHFGREIMMLERMMRDGKAAQVLSNGRTDFGNEYCNICSRYGNCSCRSQAEAKVSEYTNGSYSNGVFSPSDELKYSLVMQIEVPREFSDPKHWGHLAWKICEYMDRSLSVREAAT